MDRETIIAKTTLLFRQNGYHNTSMEDIARSCEIKKPSLYHHITSRETLLLEVLRQLQEDFNGHILKIATTSLYSPKERLHLIAKATETFIQERDGFCLVGKLVHEISDKVPSFVEFAQGFFKQWTEVLATLLKTNYTENQAKEYAEDCIAQIQGALILGHINKNSTVLKRAINKLATLLD